jgi:hypothetical protein
MYTSVMAILFMPENMVLTQVHDKQLVGTILQTLVPTTVDHYENTYWKTSYGVRFGEKHEPIPLYKRP